MVDITSRTGVHQFEAWLRSISRIDSLLDARRLKNDIANEIRKKRILLANHDKEDWIAGDKTEDLVAYLQRLYTAKNRVEARIAVLSGGGADAVVAGVKATPSLIMEHVSETSPSRHALRDILSDPNSLSYFMEFMDRRNRSQRVQFWLHVESFKNPLESVESGDESDDEEVLHSTALAPTTGLSATIKEDMRGIYEMYFSDPKSSLLRTINAKHVRAIREFAQEDDSEATCATVNGAMKERRVRRSALLAQRQVEKEMEEDFQEFERSDLWFRAVGDLAPKKVVPPSCSSPMAHRAAPPPLVALSPTTSGIPHTEAQGKKIARPHFVTPAPVPTATPPRLDTGLGVTSSGSADSNAPLMPAKTNSAPSNLDLLFGSAEAEEGQDARAPLFADVRTNEEEEQSQRIEAIQAALTDIIADENRYSSEAVKVERRVSAAESADGFMTRGITSDSGRLENPLLSPSNSDERAQRRRKTWMFDDAEEYSYEEETDQAEAETTAGDGHLRMGSTASTSMAFEPALPGDLQLSYDIAKLTEKITKLQSQAVILDALMRKAELTGDAQELRILTKSKSAMARELRELTFQRAQYEQQEAENRLVPDRTKVAIVSSTSMTEEDGKQVVRYLIEVQQLAIDGSFASGWIVARRYNDFFAMHQRLKEKYVAVRGLDFPGKRLVTSLSSSFVDTRRAALERYLQVHFRLNNLEGQRLMSRCRTSSPSDLSARAKN
jgi:sorting nexin-25